MKAQEYADKLKAGFQGELAKIDVVKAGLEDNIVTVDALVTAAHAEGYQEGQDSMVMPNPEDPAAQYTQADMDQLKETVRKEKDEEFAAKISALDAKIAELEVQVADIPAIEQAAVAAFKADLKAKYVEQQVAETAAETGFADLLV